MRLSCFFKYFLIVNIALLGACTAKKAPMKFVNHSILPADAALVFSIDSGACYQIDGVAIKQNIEQVFNFVPYEQCGDTLFNENVSKY